MKKLIVAIMFLSLVGCTTTNQQAGTPTSALKQGQKWEAGPNVTEQVGNFLDILFIFETIKP